MKKFVFIMIGIFILAGIAVTAKEIAFAGDPPEIKINVTLDKSMYIPGESIKINLSLANEGFADVITSKGFSDTLFHLLLRFMDDQGNIITSKSMGDSNITPAPPSIFLEGNAEFIQGEPVEVLACKNADGTYGWFATFDPFPAHDFYPLAGRSGSFSVKAVIPMSTYPAVQGDLGAEYALLDSADWHGTIESNIASFTLINDSDGDGYFYPEPLPESSLPADCDDSNPGIYPGAAEISANGIDDDCNPDTPDVEPSKEYGVIKLKAYKHTVGLGSNPGSVKEPMQYLPVRVYDKSAGSCVSDEYGVSWHHYKSVWENCSHDGIGITQPDGTSELSMLPGNYIVIARYDSSTEALDDDVFMGVSVGEVDPGVTIEKYLQMKVKPNGKKDKKEHQKGHTKNENKHMKE